MINAIKFNPMNNDYYARFNHENDKLETWDIEIARRYAANGDTLAKVSLAIYEEGVKSVDDKIKDHLKGREEIRKAAFNEFKLMLFDAYEKSGCEESKLGKEILKILESK